MGLGGVQQIGGCKHGEPVGVANQILVVVQRAVQVRISGMPDDREGHTLIGVLLFKGQREQLVPPELIEATFERASPVAAWFAKNSLLVSAMSQ